ncbi:forkhead-associated domain-containing 1-like isoform X1 [Brachionus plicatilis]|uniref:Forkhead-associated domain-containing 1-like isoform X1 n=1 Tax=Brachionus plicatilis TaxID=10195 RepID=A0A3M7QPF1_BRAPC|nr:forkhead-associated domain-containing 1-like isoform X1 [Brachionus plicatilis]
MVLIFIFIFSFDKFRNYIIQTIYSTPGITQPTDSEITDEFISSEWKKIVDERTNLINEIDSLKTQLSNNEESSSSLMKNLGDLDTILKQIESNLVTNGRRGATLEAEVKKLDELELHPSLLELKHSILSLYNNEKGWQTNRVLLLVVQQKFDALKREKEELQSKIEEIQAEKEKSLQEQIDLKNQEMAQKQSEFENELNSKIELEIEKLNKEHQEILESIKNESASQIDQVNQEKSSLLSQIENLTAVIEKLKNDLEIAQAQDELLKF